MIPITSITEQEYLDISRLNNELINMQRELAKRNVELDRLKNNLETLVEERTVELMAINDQLMAELVEHRRVEKALRVATGQLQILFGVSPLAVVVLDMDGCVQLWNPAAEKIFGWQESEIINQPNPLVPEDKQDEYKVFSQQVIQGGALVDQEAVRQRKDGSRITVSISSAMLFGLGDKPMGRMAIFTDVTERKQAETALRESEEKFRSVIAQSTDGIRLIDSQGIICEWNRALEEITGLKRDEVMGKQFLEALIANIPDELRTAERLENFKKLMLGYLNSTAQGTLSASSVYTIQRRDGSRRKVQSVVSRIQTSKGAMLCGVVRDITELKQREAELDIAHRELAQSYDLTLEGWARALEIRESETAGHSKRVADLAYRLAQDVGMEEGDLVHLRRGALLHDIGKMGIPDSILLKPGALTAEEWRQMKQHPIYAFEMIQDIPYLQPAFDIPYSHHEKWDGTGYPRGLKGEEISLAARIFALVDVYDALTTDRPYRKAWSRAQTLEYIREQSGSHFDPELVARFLNIMETPK